MLFMPPAFADVVAETGRAPSLHDVYTDMSFCDVVAETQLIASLHDASLHDASLHATRYSETLLPKIFFNYFKKNIFTVFL